LVHEAIRRNISLPSVKARAKRGFEDKKWELDAALEYCEKFRVKTPHIDVLCRNLSGGNQQKVVLAKWFVANSDILLLDEPTRGIDVNAKSEMYSLIGQYTQDGGSVVMVSSDLLEIFGICDRIMVMRGGRVTGCLPRQEATEEIVMRLTSLDEEEIGNG
jgi:ABC-type sugar transport system ATPase subunit